MCCGQSKSAGLLNVQIPVIVPYSKARSNYFCPQLVHSPSWIHRSDAPERQVSRRTPVPRECRIDVSARFERRFGLSTHVNADAATGPRSRRSISLIYPSCSHFSCTKRWNLLIWSIERVINVMYIWVGISRRFMLFRISGNFVRVWKFVIIGFVGLYIFGKFYFRMAILALIFDLLCEDLEGLIIPWST